jgi:hypothetical protein
VICFCSSRYRWLPRLCALVCVFFGCCTIPPAGAQIADLEKPLQTIDEDLSAFAFGLDGRIVYSVRRNVKTKLYDLEHDDIWLLETNGKKRRLLQGDKFKYGSTPILFGGRRMPGSYWRGFS